MNASQLNETFEDDSITNGRLDFRGLWTVVFISMSALDGLAVYVLYVCRNLSFQIRFLAIHLFISDACMFLPITVLSTVSLLAKNSIYWTLTVARHVAFHTFVLSFYLFTTLITLERLMAIRFTMKYDIYVTKTNLKAAISFVWTIAASILIAGIYQAVSVCNDSPSECMGVGPNATKTVRVICCVVFCICTVVITVSCLLIMIEVRSQRIQLHKRYSQSGQILQASTMRMYYMVLSCLILLLPTLLLVIARDLIGFVFSPGIRKVIEGSAGACIVLKSIVALYMHVFMSKECRMRFINRFCTFNSVCLEKHRELRMEIFNIPTTKERVDNK